MLTLWQIITGGMDWAVAVNPLMDPSPLKYVPVRGAHGEYLRRFVNCTEDHTGPVPVFVVFCYIAFALLALLNVITGVPAFLVLCGVCVCVCECNRVSHGKLNGCCESMLRSAYFGKISRI